MHLQDRLLTAILAFIFIIAIFLGNFVFLLNNTGFHTSAVERLGVNESTALNVVSYVNGKSSLSSDFNSRESTHLADVRNIFANLKRFYYASLVFLAGIIIYLIITKKFYQLVPAALIFSGAASLLLLVILFIFSLNFASFFNALHKPFFDANTWIFPADSLLITTFPQQFFQDYARNLLRLIFVNSAIFFGIGLYIRKKFKQQNL